MKTAIKTTIGGLMIVGALGFGYTMNGIAEVNKPHQFTAEFQRGTTPGPEYAGIITEVAALMEANDNYTLRVLTHTGTRGPDAGNMTLSEQRGDRVLDDLDRAGVDTSRVTIVPMGEASPPVQGDHETDALWQRRSARAEFFIEV